MAAKNVQEGLWTQGLEVLAQPAIDIIQISWMDFLSQGHGLLVVFGIAPKSWLESTQANIS